MTDKPTYKELARKMADLEIKTKDRLQFERLLTELSAAFVNIQPKNLAEKASLVIQNIGAILRVDRTAIVQMVRESGQTELTYALTNKATTPQVPVIPNDV